MAGTCKKCGGPTTDTRERSEKGLCFNCEHGLTRDPLTRDPLTRNPLQNDEQPDQLEEQPPVHPVHPVHPFLDSTRRADIQFYPPSVPPIMMVVKKIRVQVADERSVEFTDDRGNYYRITGMPYSLVSFDPGFDPDTEGRIIRGGGLA